MFNLLTRKPAPKKKQKPKLGYFNTELGLDLSRPIDIKAVTKRSFQKSPADFMPVDAAGNKLEIRTGMDSSIEQIKQLNSGNTVGLNEIQFCYYAGFGFIGYQNCAMLAQHWLIDKACLQPGEDAARHGWEISINDGSEIKPEAHDKISALDKKLGMKAQCIEFTHMGRVFGIRIAVPVFTEVAPGFFENPFNIDAVKPGTYRGWTQIDPYWITPELDLWSATDPADPNFYEPTWWRINGKRYHRSHLIIYRHSRVADILKPSYLYGGPSVPQQIAERVYAAERTANEGPILAMSKRLTVLNVDISQVVANPQLFQQKMDAWAALRDNSGVKVVGESEKIEQFDTALSDLDAVIMTQYQLVAAAARVPADKLLGTSPKGFSSTGEYETKSYHEELESLQENKMTKLLDRHYVLLMKSEFNEDVNITVQWNAVDSPTADEQAETNNKKATTDKLLVDAGAIDGTDVRQRLVKDKDSGYTGIPEIVPGGPGDREHEQEVAATLLENTNAPAEPRSEAREQTKE